MKSRLIPVSTDFILHPFLSDAREPVRVAAAVRGLSVERLFDRPAAVDDSADRLDDGERVVSAGVENVPPYERAAHVRPRLEPRFQLAQERRRVADGLAAEQ